jgi:GTPase SAR1 family protein
MGNCGSGDGVSAAELAVSKQIDQEIKKAQEEFKKQVKMLLLGPGESGKSTVFKQMKIIQDNGGFSQDELLGFKHVIHSNCLSQMRALIQAAAHLQMQFRSENAFRAAQYLLTLPQHGANWSREIASMIKVLWFDQGIRDTYGMRGKRFQLNDTADYFFDNIDRFMDDYFVPTEADVLRCRVRSTGIEEAQFLFDGLTFTMVDVGGQRSERRKWIHCFDNVTAVLYCGSLSCYDLVLREDNTQNRMAEAILLFDEVSNSAYFRTRSIILFLNKTDLFAQKILVSDLRQLFPEYNGGANYEAGCTFIRDRFLERSRSGAKVYVHFTCALDTKNIEFVIRSVRDTIMRNTLDEMGLGIDNK